MRIREIACKTALSHSSLPGLMYSLNPYRGCMHKCAYCYAPNILRIPRHDWGEILEVKRNIPVVLAKEIRTKTPGIIGISTVTDPYQPLERTYKLTRLCLEQLIHHEFYAHIQTKSALVTRDIDVLLRLHDAQVMFSIGTLHDDERRVLEPGTSSIPDRFKALKQCADAGLQTAVFLGPIYPTTTIEEIPQILDMTKDAGASEIWIDTLRLRPGIWENLQHSIRHNTALLQMFSTRVFQEKNYYSILREEIRKKAKERNIKIIDAF
ncbi:MAG: radical SAM protein [Candidatus Thermoplasmatota archaeon]|nr:radical SAM protein [Candidatus Thermoplasmatota archaeon]